MEPLNQPQPAPGSNKPMLPNATAVLILGICSIVFGCFFVGLALGIVGIILSGKGRKIYKEAPNAYEGYGQLNAGYIMSIIGTCLSALYILWWIIWVAILGTATGMFWGW